MDIIRRAHHDNFHITSFFGDILELHIMVGAQDVV